MGERVGRQKEVPNGENIAMSLQKKLSPVNSCVYKKNLQLYRLTKYIQSLTLNWGRERKGGGGKVDDGKESEED